MGIEHDRHNTAAARKNKEDRTKAEQEFLDLWRKHVMNRHSYPIWDFAEQNATDGSFRYLGKGVKLGEGGRIVCWYKQRGNGNYRAVYGDLSIKDVDPDDLPLPVE